MNIYALHSIRRLAIVCLLVSACAAVPRVAVAASAAEILNKLAVPPNTTFQIVSYNAVHNGVPQAIGTLASSNPVEVLSGFYRQLWLPDSNAKVPGYMESQLRQWQIISHLENGYNIVVQLSTQAEHGGTTGFVSVRAVNTVLSPLHHGVFSDLDLLSSNLSVDGVDTSSVQVYASALSVRQTHELYRRRLVENGWAILADSRLKTNQAMVLSREQSRLELTFMPSREYASVLVAHRVTSE